jgi:hypothetical protein
VLAHPAGAYRWLRDFPIQVAATVTVVNRLIVPEVLRGFGADAEHPVDLAELLNEPGRRLVGNLGEFDLALHSQ